MRSGFGIALAVALAMHAAAPSWAGDMTVEVVDDRIRARFDHVPLREAVAAVARAGGTELIGTIEMSPAVTLTLDRVSLEEAFERLLAPGSFLLVYGTDGGLRRVRVLGGADTVQVVFPRASLPVPSPARMLPLDLLDVEVTVAPDGPLARQLGRSPATVRKLSQLALHDPDPAMRDAAVEAAMDRIQGDAELQAALDLLLQNTDQQTLADQLRVAAGADGTDFITRMLRFTRNGDTRERLLTLLKTLRADSGAVRP